MDLLVADIGGTHVRLAKASCQQKLVRLSHLRIYDTIDFQDFETTLAHYLGQLDGAQINVAVFAVAGPVKAQSCTLTNLNWTLYATELKSRFNFKECTLLNDLEAIAWGIDALTPEESLVIQAGTSAVEGNRCVLAPGTGLGEAGLILHQGESIAFASEGGHADFAPTNEIEWRLYQHLREDLQHVSWEHLLSGAGLERIYQFFVRESPSVSAPCRRPAAEITQAATQNECALCVAAVNLFSELLAAEASNLGLKLLATGGVFLAGNISLKMLPFIQRSEFISRFRQKGRMSHLVDSMPLSIIRNQQCALLGAACYAQRASAA